MAAAVAQQFTPKKRERFLHALAECGNVTLSAERVHCSREAVYRARRADPAFAAAWDEAFTQAFAVLEQEAFRRAHDGTEKPVYQGGELVGTIREYSDTLLIFLLKGAKPEKYRDNVKISGQIEHGFLPAREDMAHLHALRARFADRPDILDEIAAALVTQGTGRGKEVSGDA